CPPIKGVITHPQPSSAPKVVKNDSCDPDFGQAQRQRLKIRAQATGIRQDNYLYLRRMCRMGDIRENLIPSRRPQHEVLPASGLLRGRWRGWASLIVIAHRSWSPLLRVADYTS